MKGILLAGGAGTRLYPLTAALSKQLLPVYDKPMVYYPLSVLMLAGIREILIMSDATNLPHYEALLGDGSRWGLQLTYAAQAEPNGLAAALLLGQEFIAGEPVCMILGDNLFFGQGLPELLRRAAALRSGARIFAYRVSDPGRYGVVTLDGEGRALRLEEKPARPESDYAVPGLYFYDGGAVARAAMLKPSERGELEITDLNRAYLQTDELEVELLGRGIAWLDAGTPDSLMQAAGFVQAVQQRQGLMISCPEEIAYRMGFIRAEDLQRLAEGMGANAYRAYLLRLLSGVE